MEFFDAISRAAATAAYQMVGKIPTGKLISHLKEDKYFYMPYSHE